MALTNDIPIPILVTLKGHPNSHDILVLPPRSTTMETLRHTLITNFVLSDAYISNMPKLARPKPTYIIGLTVEWFRAGQMAPWRITVVHPANLEAVLRLLGQARGELGLSVEVL